MPLPTLPSKLGAILSADEIKAAPKATPPAQVITPQTTSPIEATPSAPAKPKAPLVAKTASTEPSSPPRATKNAKKTTKATQPAKNPTTAPEPRKLFVLDTNVLLHDSNCLFKFEEHDVFIPMMVLEELDHQKKGLSEVARNARQVSRYLEALVEDKDISQGIALNGAGHIEARGQLFFQTTALSSQLPIDLPVGIADNAILHVVHALQSQHGQETVVMVSKDINMRLKARALGIHTEDYRHDHVLSDSDLLYEGARELPDDFWNNHGQQIESWQQAGITFYKIQGPLCAELSVNEFVYTTQEPGLIAQVKQVSSNKAVLATIRDYSHSKNNVWGITARNQEQNFALNLLMNPECDFVSLLGQAGTGKTLLALASALTQTLETQLYNEIIITRATVPVGDEIGFLPGTEEEKMAPWMGALEDNLEVLHLGSNKLSALNNDPNRNATMDIIRSHIKIKSMSFMRGRTFQNKFLIIDEAQNLTPKQMKTLVTRAGPGTKIVCMGNIAQIDTPYLTEGSSGLTYVVDRFKGWPHSGHITLQRGERSRLADYANEAL
ncbi:PhoH family protein [uncultured Paenalcaligenes sp.]|uniref:PhoH family protein n=1 Tax=uncultured Paenalcaligenes sp. TaxID=1588925 RepID=UPI0026302653|nr:PhoH family protein [uncultured Paenalcaligenes sp.]